MAADQQCCRVSGSICRVPDILFTTIEPPADLPIVGKGCFIQARICRPKKDSRGEANAKEISDVRHKPLCRLAFDLFCGVSIRPNGVAAAESVSSICKKIHQET